MATTDIGRVTPIWRGFYSAANTYELNDIVIDTAGSVWWHKSEELTTGVIPEAGEIWDAVIDMSIFSGLIQAAITTAQTALEAAQAAVSEVTADTERAETAARIAEASALSASESAANVGAYAQAAEEAKNAAQTAATQAAASASSAGTSASSAGSSAQAAEASKTAAQTAAAQAAGSAQTASGAAAVVEQKKTEAIAAIEAKGEEVLESIPEDYTELSGDVGDLKTQLSESNEEGTFKKNIPITWNQGKFTLSGSTITIDTTATNRCYSDYINISDYGINEEISIEVPNGLQLYGVLVDSNSGTVTKNKNIASWETGTVTFTRSLADYTYVLLMASKTTASNPITPSECGFVASTSEYTLAYETALNNKSEIDGMSDYQEQISQNGEDGTYNEYIGITWNQGKFTVSSTTVTIDTTATNRCYSNYIDISSLSLNEEINVSVPDGFQLYAVLVDSNSGTISKNKVVASWVTGTATFTRTLNSYTYLILMASKTTTLADVVPLELGAYKLYTVSETKAYNIAKKSIIDNALEFDITDLEAGYYNYIASSDRIAEVEYSYSYKSGYIPVEYGRTVKISNFYAVNGLVLILCDYNKKYLTEVRDGSSSVAVAEYEFTVPVGACYVLFTTSKTQHDQQKTTAVYTTDTTSWSKADASVKKIENVYGRNIYYPFRRLKAQTPMLSIVDDDTDNFDKVQKFYQACMHNGVVGNYAVVTFKLFDEETSGRGEVLKEALLDYEADGFGCLIHAHEQNSWYETGANRDALKCNQDFTQGLREMQECGFTNYKYWIAPGGHYDIDMETIAKRHGIKCLAGTAFTTYNKGTDWNKFCIKRTDFSYDDAHQYPAGWTIDDIKAEIDDCVSTNGWLVLTTHFKDWVNAGVTWDSTLDANGFPVGYARFNEVIQYALNAGMVVKSFPHAFEDFLPYYNFNEIYGWIEHQL